MAQKTMIQAITEAMDQALEKDENILIFGEDVGKNGGVFRATAGLQAKYGEERVFDTPLAESGIGGLAIGLALQGYRPMPEIQFIGFIFEVMDSIVGQAARWRYRLGGSQNMPLVFRTPFGGGVHTPEMHADNLEGLIAQSPGIKVVIPSNPYDAKGLLLAAIEDNDPVFFMEHMKLYRSFRGEVPEEYYTIPLGKANVVKQGSDLSIITYGAMVQEAQKAADALEAEGISAEVLDLRTVSPLDIDAIRETAEKTGRVVIVQEAQRMAGVGAQVAARIAEHSILSLKAPIARVAAPDTVYPFGMAEKEWLPNSNDIIEAAKGLMTY